jgi:DNA-binding transcriptional ArsR family regulator
MNITFKPAMGEIRNLLDSLYFLYNKNYKKNVETFNIKPDKAVEEALEFLSERVSFNIKQQELFFKEDIFTLAALVSLETLEKCESVMDYIDALKSLDAEEAKYRVLKNLDKSDLLEEDIRAVLKDEKKTIDFIRNLELPSSIKWDIFEFFQDVKTSINELAAFLNDYYPLCMEVLEKNKAAIREFDDYLLKGIETDGEAFIKKNTMDAMDLSDVNELFAASIFFNSHSLSFSSKGSKLYIYFGIKFEEAVKGLLGEEQVEVNLNILKNIADKTRFQILMLLKDKEMYGQEIADKIGITMATVSYHMSYLLISNMVLIDKVGHKGYYKLNKETLRRNVEFLKGIFQL